MVAEDGGSYAFRCRTCDGSPHWRLERRGDAVVSWACGNHLGLVAAALQRSHETTELAVTPFSDQRAA